MRSFLARTLPLTLVACLGRVKGVDDGPPADGPVTPAAVPACPGIPSAPADRDPTDSMLLASDSELTAIGLDATDVYFGSADQVRHRPLKAVPKTGGAVRALHPAYAYQIEIDGDTIFVGTSASVAAYPKAGGASRGVGDGLFSFALDGEAIYGGNLASGVISRRMKDGSGQTELAVGKGSQGVSVYGDYVYWSNYPAHTASRVRTTGGPTEELGTFPDFTRDVVADCHYVYVSVGNYGDSVYRVPIGGGRPELFVNDGGTLALDSHALYIQNTKQTSRVSLATGRVVSLGEGHGQPGGLSKSIVVDNDAVYWINSRGVMRARK